jgi:hypothetical protein
MEQSAMHKSVQALHISCATLRQCDLRLADLSVYDLIAESPRGLPITVQSHDLLARSTRNNRSTSERARESSAPVSPRFRVGVLRALPTTLLSLNASESFLSSRWRDASLRPRGNIAELVAI